ncbi:MAG: hypothetical protein UT69_C0033G0007 [Candidatus Yanofskybacteria bacterium GW2011_GWE1_40_10]|nr:MAG: hypothetical protein UT69_C0033G0007 [Candidatus Yanofskybacteria bacterium GW2011_GWE1_40_10]OGN36661.1 MAG: hypothetical protein A2241_02610 [Candidatus Yanofskybacteria bacterium RIFOXYA2_FULL_45_28]
MAIKEQIQADMKEAMKSGNAAKRMTLSMVMSSIKNKELEKRGKAIKADASLDAAGADELSKLTDEEIVEVVSSEIKRRKDSITSYTDGGRPELAEKENEEIAFISPYMPEQLSDEAVKAEVEKAVQETGAAGPKDMGKVIGAVMARIKGKADGQLVSKLVKEALQ